jgi:hypothetical protein
MTRAMFDLVSFSWSIRAISRALCTDPFVCRMCCEMVAALVPCPFVCTIWQTMMVSPPVVSWRRSQAEAFEPGPLFTTWITRQFRAVQ